MMETVAKLREMPHWSYSAMQCYLSCPLKYKFRYIDNAEPERTGSCFPFGRAFHAALSERARIGIDMSERVRLSPSSAVPKFPASWKFSTA